MSNQDEPVPAAAHDQAVAMRAKHPPIWQELVFELYFKPRSFFADQVTLWKTRYVFAACWIAGIAGSIDRISQELLEADMKGGEATAPLELLFSSWLNYWGLVLATGAIGGFFLWWIGGWWYRVRLGWSGAKNPDHRLARLVYIYATFVYAAPLIIYTLVETAHYENAIQAYHAESFWPLLILVFLFWSLVTSYCGVRTVFDVSRWRARTWFVILPGILYALVFGVLAVVFTMFQPEAVQ